MTPETPTNLSLKTRPRSMPLLDQQVEAGLRGDFVRGQQIADQLERETPHCHRARFNRSWYEMMKGDLNTGLKLLDSGRWLGVFGDQPLPTNKPIYKLGQDLKGKSLLLCAEGGLGDEIINVRFAKDFADLGAKVAVTCDPSLASVFARIEGVSASIAHRRAPEVYHDYWVPAMSAARVLDYKYEKLSGEPYLTVHPDFQKKWSKKLSTFEGKGKPKIGLRFFGNPAFEHEQFRRFPQEGLVHAVGHRPWVSLQKEESSLAMETWEDTLAIISELDLVITSCTSVAHASAALGKATWVIVPILPYYLWALPGESSPWYKSVRLFRQTQFGCWDGVFENIKKALKESF